MAVTSIDFSATNQANATLAAANSDATDGCVITPNGNASAIYIRAAVAGDFYAGGSTTEVPYDADVWTRVWGRGEGSKLNIAGTVTVKPDSTTTIYARQE